MRFWTLRGNWQRRGIESAFSRGQRADFVDQQKAACAVIRSNLEQTKFPSRSNVHCMPIAQFLRRKEEPYDFVILDPPYADPNIVETLKKLASSPLVNHTIVVLGHWPRFGNSHCNWTSRSSQAAVSWGQLLLDFRGDRRVHCSSLDQSAPKDRDSEDNRTGRNKDSH